MEKVKKDYYYYVDLVNKKRKKKKEIKITFERFYNFYINAILYAEKKNLNPNLALIDESFYEDYYNAYIHIYNEEEQVENQPKQGFFKKATGTVGGMISTAFNKLKSLSSTVASFFVFIGMKITQIAVSTVNIIYEAIVDSISWINIVFQKLNTWKANLFEAIKNGIIEIIGGEQNIKLIKEKIADQKTLSTIKKFLNSGPIRVSIAVIICCVILYVWTNSAFSGNIFYDFNIEGYTKILTTNDIFSELKIEVVIEVIAWYILNQIVSIPISWFGAGSNVYLVIGLIVVSLLFKYIEKNSIIIGDIDFKQKICMFLNNKGTPKMPSDIIKLVSGIAQNIGVFGPQKNVKDIFCNTVQKKQEQEQVEKNTSSEVKT